jgi:hypothetical protein
MNEQHLKQLWKEQPVAVAPDWLERVKADARRMNRGVALRNAVEYAASAFVLAGFGFYILAFPHPLMRLGSGLIIAATLFVVWQLRRRASGARLPTGAVAESWVAFRRAQLVRQRDALRSVWLWYLAPFVPGMVVFRWGVETELAAGPFAHGLVANLVIGLVFIGVAAVNLFGARKLQGRIDELDEQAGGTL